MVAAGFSGRTSTAPQTTTTSCSLGAHSVAGRLQYRTNSHVWTPVVCQQRQRRRSGVQQVHALQFFRSSNANNSSTSSTSIAAAETLASAPVATQGASAELYVQDAARLAGLAPPTFVQATGRVVASMWRGGCVAVCAIVYEVVLCEMHGQLPAQLFSASSHHSR